MIPPHHIASYNSIVVAVPDEITVRKRYESGEITFPYWAKIWPASVALSQFLHENPSLTDNRSVLELAAGLGLPSLQAAVNATSVVCTDLHAEPLQYAGESARRNGFANISFTTMDIVALPVNLQADVVLMSDINYDAGLLEGVLRSIQYFLRSGSTIVLATPHRIIARELIMSLTRWCVRSEERIIDATAISLFILSQSPKAIDLS